MIALAEAHKALNAASTARDAAHLLNELAREGVEVEVTAFKGLTRMGSHRIKCQDCMAEISAALRRYIEAQREYARGVGIDPLRPDEA